MPLGNRLGWVLVLAIELSMMAQGGVTARVPDWVRTAAAAPMPRTTAFTEAAILDESETYTVDDHGRTTHQMRQVVKILKSHAREEYGTYREEFNKDSKVDYVHSWTIAADGKEYELKDRDVVERGEYEGHDLYSDTSYKQATALMVGPDAIIAFESQKREAPYQHSDILFLQERVPVAHHRITLNLPAGWEYNTAWVQMSEVKPTQVGPNSWQWDIGELDAIDFDRQPMHPNYFQLAGRMLLTWFGGPIHAEAGTWANAGLWVESVTAGRPEVTPAIASTALTLTTGKTGFVEQVAAITTFMQDEVRYFAIDLGIGGYQPHFASEVYQHRYGDCKDKVTLLIALLKSVGIRAHYVIVCTHRGYINPAIPTASGNHAIVAIEIPEGTKGLDFASVATTKAGKKLVIFDPTDAYLPVGQLSTYLQGGFGLLADGEKSQLIRLPVLNADDNRVTFAGKFALNDQGKLNGQLVETRSGGLAQERRALYVDGTSKDQREVAEEFLGRNLSNFTLEKVAGENVHQRDQPMVVKYDITAPNYAKSSGSMLLVRPRVAGTDSEPLDAQQPRRFSVQFNSLYSRSEDYTITLPAGYKAEELPEPVSLDSEFATYKSITELTGQELHFRREFKVKVVEVPKERYAEFRKFEGRVANDENAPAMLMRTTQP